MLEAGAARHRLVRLGPVGEGVGSCFGRQDGDRDRYTDARESFAYALRAKQRGVRICRFDVPGAGHFMISRAGAWHRIVYRFVLGTLGIEPEDPVIANALRQPAASGLRSTLSGSG